jgi:hypothetical protein
MLAPSRVMPSCKYEESSRLKISEDATDPLPSPEETLTDMAEAGDAKEHRIMRHFRIGSESLPAMGENLAIQ